MAKKTSIFWWLCLIIFASNVTVAQPVKRPKLIVGIVVDQMRWDYLYRFKNRYNGGLKRLLNKGFSCENTSIDYVPTVTAAGHASIYTGTVPAIHGISGNDFIIQETGKRLYCVEDSSVRAIGLIGNSSQFSPKNLLSTTITDEIKLATNFRSKVIGIALKDRGAILPAGHSADAAYWFEDSIGEWISSSYYMKTLPDYVKKFNQKRIHEKYLSEDWHTLYPIASYHQSDTDLNDFEGSFAKDTRAVFPISTSTLMKKNKGLIRNTPFGNTFTLDFANLIIENEALGKHSDTDFLTISLSSTDYLGHQLGINAVEIEDTYLRLDRDLAVFFRELDQKIGKGKYTVFLTADHGAANNVRYMQSHKLPADIWDASKVQKQLNDLLFKTFKEENLVLGFHNFQLNLNLSLIKKAEINFDDLTKIAINFLKQQPGVIAALDVKTIQQENIPFSLKERLANGYHSQRSGSVQIVLFPGWYFSSSLVGTSHGTGYAYDTHIPLLFMGWGITQGKLNRSINMSDIAATLAALLKIQEPSGSIGKPIIEALKNMN